jgi:hypothetical protein
VNPSSPFKYNSTWANLEELFSLVNSIWKPYSMDSIKTSGAQFFTLLQFLKQAVVSWDNERMKLLDSGICQI